MLVAPSGGSPGKRTWMKKTLFIDFAWLPSVLLEAPSALLLWFLHQSQDLIRISIDWRPAALQEFSKPQIRIGLLRLPGLGTEQLQDSLPLQGEAATVGLPEPYPVSLSSKAPFDTVVLQFCSFRGFHEHAPSMLSSFDQLCKHHCCNQNSPSLSPERLLSFAVSGWRLSHRRMQLGL